MQRRPQTPVFPRHRAPSCFHSGVGRNCLCTHAAPCLKKAPVQSGNPGGVLTQDSSRGSCFTLIKQSSVFPFSVGFIQVLTTSIETDLPEKVIRGSLKGREKCALPYLPLSKEKNTIAESTRKIPIRMF